MKQNLIGIKFLLVIFCCILLCYHFLQFDLVRINDNEKFGVRNLMDSLKMENANVGNIITEIVLKPSCGLYPERETMNISDKY